MKTADHSCVNGYFVKPVGTETSGLQICLEPKAIMV